MYKLASVFQKADRANRLSRLIGRLFENSSHCIYWDSVMPLRCCTL